MENNYIAVANRRRETVGRNLSTTNWGVRISELGYTLYGGSVDSFGRSWKYRIFPNSAGSVGQFGSLAELGAWVRRADRTRALSNWSDEYFAALPNSVFSLGA